MAMDYIPLARHNLLVLIKALEQNFLLNVQCHTQKFCQSTLRRNDPSKQLMIPTVNKIQFFLLKGFLRRTKLQVTVLLVTIKICIRLECCNGVAGEVEQSPESAIEVRCNWCSSPFIFSSISFCTCRLVSSNFLSISSLFSATTFSIRLTLMPTWSICCSMPSILPEKCIQPGVYYLLGLTNFLMTPLRLVSPSLFLSPFCLPTVLLSSSFCLLTVLLSSSFCLLTVLLPSSSDGSTLQEGGIDLDISRPSTSFITKVSKEFIKRSWQRYMPAI
ncbi:hypothetical protein NQ318_014684 [Aromia moschata]|uniref:Uncharacterized protein n=1 Tax=Aromia moschata TaxID=1265417 RepID=A0AAV8ZBX4_9CUCU|nr:hypothetical protein NQ318_014684 [Aromia moschata]